MKKILIVIALLVSCYVNQLKSHAFDESLNSSVLFNVLDEEHFSIIDAFNHTLLTSTKEGIELREDGVVKLLIEESYQSHLMINKILYLATNKSLYKIDLTNFLKEQLALPIPIIKQINYYQDHFWYVGSKDDDGIIIKVDKQDQVIRNYEFGGDGYECFDYLFWLGNKLIVIGHKTAHSYDGPFAHVGSKGDIKSFIVKFNNAFKIEDIFYFNHQTVHEIITMAQVKNNLLHLYLKTPTDTFYYQFDHLLNPIRHHNLNILEENAIGLIGQGNHFIHIIKDKTKIFWQVEGKPWDEKRVITEDGSLLYALIEQGVLKVYVLDEGRVIRYSLYEHHIERLEPFIVSRADGDVEGLSNIIVSSYFEDLRVSIKEISPFFSKLISGTYDVTYLIERTDGTSFTLKSQIIVPDYTNVMDKGIYQTGYQLLFFGKALLNGESILNGYLVNEPGLYQLVLTDCFGKKTTLNFLVVSDYYQDEVSLLIPADYYLHQDEQLTLSIPINTLDVPEAIIINGERYLEYQIEEDKILITINAKDRPSLDKYVVEKIVYNNYIVTINQVIVIQTLKKAPQIDLSEKIDKNLTLIGQISDVNQSIIGFETSIYQKNQLIKKVITPMQDEDIIFNVQKDLQYQIITKVLYEIGDGEVYEIILVDHEVTFDDEVVKYLNLTFKKDKKRFSEVQLVYNTSNKKATHHQLKVLQTNLEKNYQIEKDDTALFITIFITLLIVVGFSIIYYKRKKKNKLSS